MSHFVSAPSVMRQTLRQCLAAAVRAPSGDNMQPWHFKLDEDAASITVLVDSSRDPSPMNSGQSMSRIACGAAVENILIEAIANGCDAEVEAGKGFTAAIVRLTPPGNHGATSGLKHAIYNRVTNRRIYDKRPVSSQAMTRLRQSTPTLEGVSTHWILDRNRIEALSKVIGEADATMLGERSMRNAFLSNVRFDRSARENVEAGLSLSSLELSALDRFAMREMHYIPGAILRATGTLHLFAAHARRLAQSASGLCVIAAPNATDCAFVRAGRCMQRAWLALTEQGMAVQPMMSLLVLSNALDHGTPKLIAALGRERIESLLEQFRTLVPEITGLRPLFLMRCGHAQSPNGRTGRLEPNVTHE